MGVSTRSPGAAALALTRAALWTGAAAAIAGAAAWTASLWVVSYRFPSGSTGLTWTVVLDRGQLLATDQPTFFSPGLSVLPAGPRVRNLNWWPAWPWLEVMTLSTGQRLVSLTLPLWPLPVAGVLIAAPAWRSLRRRRAAERGACTGCGYSLAGLADGAACPECGTPRRLVRR
ncbi:MAG TPA: hypothetical protein VFF65_10465 [Phycisphaerales bacterium]|nr:hypothetical protein [Phycisphaerales bacterium]